jgi:protein-L-isoaspartate(D-aspartate) O-methyltransferase
MRPTEDNWVHKGKRKKLIEQIRAKGISDERVLQAMEQVPRHFFLESAFTEIAYEDRAFPIGASQTISQPYTVAYQTQLLRVQPMEKILEIGTGSTYQACVLSELGARVYTIERQKPLFDEMRKFRYPDKYKWLKFFYGDGFEGLPTFAPFDKILITAAAPEIPPKLMQQLKVGGNMVLPLNEGDAQRMLRLTKLEDGSFQTETFDMFSFVPMLSGKAQK